MIGQQCVNCIHYEFLQECPAFNEKIPQEIFEGSFIHDKPHKEQIDNSILYEPINKDLELWE